MIVCLCQRVSDRDIDRAVQVHGGWGFMDDCPASRYLRDNRICTIGDGSSQIQLLLIARGLGLDVAFDCTRGPTMTGRTQAPAQFSPREEEPKR